MNHNTHNKCQKTHSVPDQVQKTKYNYKKNKSQQDNTGPPSFCSRGSSH